LAPIFCLSEVRAGVVAIIAQGRVAIWRNDRSN
jgi:hypothetical protein